MSVVKIQNLVLAPVETLWKAHFDPMCRSEQVLLKILGIRHQVRPMFKLFLGLAHS